MREKERGSPKERQRERERERERETFITSNGFVRKPEIESAKAAMTTVLSAVG